MTRSGKAEALGLFDLFEEIFDWVTDFFDSPETSSRRNPLPSHSSGPSALSASDNGTQQAFWEKTSQLISPEFMEALSRETGWSTLKLGMKIQGPCQEVLQRWQRIGRPITDLDLKAMRQEIREKLLRA